MMRSLLQKPEPNVYLKQKLNSSKILETEEQLARVRAKDRPFVRWMRDKYMHLIIDPR